MSDARAQFVEKFASTLTDAGFPRLAARVFANLLISETGRMTAEELARDLHASTGGVSGAVRYLTQVRLIRTERDPGTRRHSYVIDPGWFEATVTSNAFLDRGEADLAEGIALVGQSTPTGRRLRDTVDLIRFLRQETTAMLERWHDGRLNADSGGGT